MPLPQAKNYPAGVDNGTFNTLAKDPKSKSLATLYRHMTPQDVKDVNTVHPDLSYLGHGNNGVAYEHSDPNTVVKITKSAREIENARNQLEREVSCLVNVHSVVMVGEGSVYKIITEKLQPLTPEEVAQVDRAQKVYKETWKFPKDTPVAIRFARLWYCLESHGIDTYDVRSDNIGKRADGSFVLLDLG